MGAGGTIMGEGSGEGGVPQKLVDSLGSCQSSDSESSTSAGWCSSNMCSRVFRGVVVVELLTIQQHFDLYCTPFLAICVFFVALLFC